MSHPRIESNPKIMFGKPVIKGTRITVELILRKFAADRTFDNIISAHPHLALEDLYAAVAFAADYIASEEIMYTDRASA